MDDARFRIELRRYWDEIARGEPATPDDLDPDLAALIRRLHALPDVPPPDPTFARQLRESLMHATTTPLRLTDPRTSLARNGQSAPPVRRPILSAFPVSPVRWAPAYLVTALLVMLVLIGSVLVIGPGRPVSQDHIPLFLAAISGTPATLETVATEAGVEHRLAAGDIYVAADPEEVVAIRVSGPETVSLLRGFVSNLQREA